MFDRIALRARPVEHHTHVNIEQKPHDTADTVRLYGEMVKQAREEVLSATIREAKADIRVVVLKIEAGRNFEREETELRVMFSLNGNKYDFKTTEASWERDLYQAIAEHIAAEVVGKLLDKKHL